MNFARRFIGKASPVHFFWGSFDLAVTRFSGRTAPPPKGVTPNVADWVMAEAYSHECLELRLLAGQWRLRPRGVLCLCLSGAGRLRRHAAAHRRSVLRQRSRAIHFALRRGSSGARSRTRCCSDFCRKPTTPRPISRNGIATRWNAHLSPRVREESQLAVLRCAGKNRSSQFFNVNETRGSVLTNMK